jgi:hypothetical protein
VPSLYAQIELIGTRTNNNDRGRHGKRFAVRVAGRAAPRGRRAQGRAKTLAIIGPRAHQVPQLLRGRGPRRQRGDLGAALHLLRPTAPSAPGERGRVHLVALHGPPRRGPLRGAGKADQQVLHRQRAHRLQQYWQRLRLAVRGVLSLLFTEGEPVASTSLSHKVLFFFFFF